MRFTNEMRKTSTWHDSARKHIQSGAQDDVMDDVKW